MAKPMKWIKSLIIWSMARISMMKYPKALISWEIQQSMSVILTEMLSKQQMLMVHAHLPITMIRTVLLQKLTNLGMQPSKHMIRMELGF